MAVLLTDDVSRGRCPAVRFVAPEAGRRQARRRSYLVERIRLRDSREHALGAATLIEVVVDEGDVQLSVDCYSKRGRTRCSRFLNPKKFPWDFDSDGHANNGKLTRTGFRKSSKEFIATAGQFQIARPRPIRIIRRIARSSKRD